MSLSNKDSNNDINNNNNIKLSDDINDKSNLIKIIKKRNKLTKKQQFKNEREVLINNLNNVIGITKENNCYFLCELEKNDNIKKYLTDNIEDIKKYYKVGKWGFFSNDISKGKDNYIGLLRSIYLDSDYEIISKSKIATFDNIKKQYTMWDFRKK
jgi:hypothetical protein